MFFQMTVRSKINYLAFLVYLNKYCGVDKKNCNCAISLETKLFRHQIFLNTEN